MAIDPNNISTIRVGQLPVGVIDNASKIAIENGTDLYQITGQDLIDYININAGTRQFQIIEMWVNQAYIDNNFDITGLGTGICSGIAICNGQNGTPPMDGLVSIGYGVNNNVIGGFGGVKDFTISLANIPKLDITVPVSNAGGGGSPYTNIIASGSGTPATKTYTNVTGTTVPTKISKMQPFIILLKCMKL